MKVIKIKDVDLSKYKIAYFHGNSLEDDKLCQNSIMLIAENKLSKLGLPRVVVALIPKDKSLLDCKGDDWDDSPARDNASGFNKYPKGTIFLSGILGGALVLADREDSE